MSDAEFQAPVGDLRELWKTPGTRLYNFTITPMTGVELIAQERLEQKTKHNHTIKSDWEQYPDFELVDAAVALLTDDFLVWPLANATFYKIRKKELQERLVIAGALIAAEIDRLNFKE